MYVYIIITAKINNIFIYAMKNRLKIGKFNESAFSWKRKRTICFVLLSFFHTFAQSM